ncbi:hypothetical protein RFI_13618, partial [Reticulomyxa filosa]
MDEEGLEKALLSLGIRLFPHARNRVLEYFNFKQPKGENELDEPIGCIDFFDFSSGISALVSGDDEEAAYILFLCYDYDDDGYLTVEDIGRLLLTENQIAATLEGGVNSSVIRYSKEKVLDKAKALLKNANCDDNKQTKEQDRNLNLLCTIPLDLISFFFLLETSDVTFLLFILFFFFFFSAPARKEKKLNKEFVTVKSKSVGYEFLQLSTNTFLSDDTAFHTRYFDVKYKHFAVDDRQRVVKFAFGVLRNIFKTNYNSDITRNKTVVDAHVKKEEKKRLSSQGKEGD